jgi:hypothetical protein
MQSQHYLLLSCLAGVLEQFIIIGFEIPFLCKVEEASATLNTNVLPRQTKKDSEMIPL